MNTMENRNHSLLKGFVPFQVKFSHGQWLGQYFESQRHHLSTINPASLAATHSTHSSGQPSLVKRLFQLQKEVENNMGRINLSNPYDDVPEGGREGAFCKFRVDNQSREQVTCRYRRKKQIILSLCSRCSGGYPLDGVSL